MRGFAKETDLCAAFLKAVPEGWTAYPETAGFDILLSRDDDGFQIGVEAKLRLNAKVIAQAMEEPHTYRICSPQPDCRAVLVPWGKARDLDPICRALGITVIRVLDEDDEHRRYRTCPFSPFLPRVGYETWDEDWFERCPDQRVALPDYVPDVRAGDSAPVALTEWKIKAIKIAVTLERRGYVTRSDFKHHKISITRWIDPYSGWLIRDGDGWKAGPRLPDFKAQHPVNYGQIAADFEDWKSPEPARQGALV